MMASSSLVLNSMCLNPVSSQPNDIRAALAAGAIPVGVLTGIFNRIQLEAAAAEHEHGMHKLIIYDTLESVDDFLQVCAV